jgi:metal-responsive CopG/Arc/MetJ family transcriptional regulator
MAAKTFTTIALPDELISEIDKIIENNKLGYRNRPELIKEAVRKLIIELRE